ncbi:MAG: hypothetical protein GY786_14860 [Proteobacteria bacterium]|nr:hypothetical protein [Pseudomonadota bacterium]
MEYRFVTKREIHRLGPRVALALYIMMDDSSFHSVDIEIDLSIEDPFEKTGKLLKIVTVFNKDRVEVELT